MARTIRVARPCRGCSPSCPDTEHTRRRDRWDTARVGPPGLARRTSQRGHAQRRHRGRTSPIARLSRRPPRVELGPGCFLPPPPALRPSPPRRVAMAEPALLRGQPRARRARGTRRPGIPRARVPARQTPSAPHLATPLRRHRREPRRPGGPPCCLVVPLPRGALARPAELAGLRVPPRAIRARPLSVGGASGRPLAAPVGETVNGSGPRAAEADSPALLAHDYDRSLS